MDQLHGHQGRQASGEELSCEGLQHTSELLERARERTRRELLEKGARAATYPVPAMLFVYGSEMPQPYPYP